MSPYDDYAVLVLCAGDVDQIWNNLPGDKCGPPVLPAAGDAKIAYVNAQNFTALGQLRCDDLYISRGKNVYYGLLLRCIAAVGPLQIGDHLVAIRGTMDPLEWANDATAEFPRPAPGAMGSIGVGFWDIYASMTFGPLAGGPQQPNAAAQIAAAVHGTPGKVFLTGHSLGAALGTYLARDLAAAFGAGTDFQPYFFASPKVGTQDYIDEYQTVVPAYTLCNFAADLVPMLPSTPPYVPLNAGGPFHDVHIIQAKAPGSPPWPRLDVAKNHSPAYYAQMLDPTNAIAKRLLP
jgi:hypothetical protein